MKLRSMSNKRPIVFVLVITFLIQLSACGTLMYPERRGQTGGRIDVGVALLDGVGLLVFLIPGIIAYAVDFSTGAIYLPNGKASLSGSEDISIVHIDPSEMSKEKIQDVVIKKAGISGSIDFNITEVRVLNETEDVSTVLFDIRQAGYEVR